MGDATSRPLRRDRQGSQAECEVVVAGKQYFTSDVTLHRRGLCTTTRSPTRDEWGSVRLEGNAAGDKRDSRGARLLLLSSGREGRICNTAREMAIRRCGGGRAVLETHQLWRDVQTLAEVEQSDDGKWK